MALRLSTSFKGKFSSFISPFMTNTNTVTEDHIKQEGLKMSMLTPYERRNDIWGAFRDFEDIFFRGSSSAGCKTDIRDMGDRYVLESELPGFDKEEIGVELNGDYLTITAQRNCGDDEQKDSYIRKERSVCSYQRSFNISGCVSDGIEAEYKNGVLKVTCPKMQKTQPQTKRLEIK